MCSLLKFMSGALLQESQLVVSPRLRDILSLRQKKLHQNEIVLLFVLFFLTKTLHTL